MTTTSDNLDYNKPPNLSAYDIITGGLFGLGVGAAISLVVYKLNGGWTPREGYPDWMFPAIVCGATTAVGLIVGITKSICTASRYQHWADERVEAAQVKKLNYVAASDENPEAIVLQTKGGDNIIYVRDDRRFPPLEDVSKDREERAVGLERINRDNLEYIILNRQR